MTQSITTESLSQTVHREFRELPTAQLFIDPLAQRELREHHATALENAYDHDFVGVLLVSARPGGRYHVMVGQHRFVAARRRGVAVLPCYVYYGLSRPREAEIFEASGNTLAISKYDDYRVKLENAISPAPQIEGVLNKYGLRTARYSAPRVIAAVAILHKLYAAGILEPTIELITTAWPDDPLSLQREVLEGVGQFLLCYEKELKADKAAARFRGSPLGTMVSNAVSSGRAMRQAPAYCFADILARRYSYRATAHRLAPFNRVKWPRRVADA